MIQINFDVPFVRWGSKNSFGNASLFSNLPRSLLRNYPCLCLECSLIRLLLVIFSNLRPQMIIACNKFKFDIENEVTLAALYLYHFPTNLTPLNY